MNSGVPMGVPNTLIPSDSGQSRALFISEGSARKLPSGMSWMGKATVGSRGVESRNSIFPALADGCTKILFLITCVVRRASCQATSANVSTISAITAGGAAIFTSSTMAKSTPLPFSVANCLLHILAVRMLKKMEAGHHLVESRPQTCGHSWEGGQVRHRNAIEELPFSRIAI